MLPRLRSTRGNSRQETGGDDRMAGTCWQTRPYRQKPFAIINLENHVFRV